MRKVRITKSVSVIIILTSPLSIQHLIICTLSVFVYVKALFFNALVNADAYESVNYLVKDERHRRAEHYRNERCNDQRNGLRTRR